MLELVLYNLSSSWLLITMFFILLFFLGCAIYLLTRKFNLKDGKIKTYGLLLNMSDKDVFILSIIIVRSFLVIYSVSFYLENIYMYLMMIAIVSVILIIFTFRDTIYEIINSASLIAVVYFTQTLRNYMIEVDNSESVQIINLILISFAILYTIYILLKAFEDITTNNENINE